jgi:site-specific recombinase XerC
METSYENAEALVRRIGGTSAEILAAFVRWLNRQHYSVSYVCVLARHALAFGRWCESCRIALSSVGDDDLGRYQHHRSRQRSRCLDTLQQERKALGLLMRYLRDEGICPRAPAQATPADHVAEDFARHLQCDQGLAGATVERYANTARRFLIWRFGQDEVYLRDLCQTDCISFVHREAKRMRPAALKTVVVALRSFLRYAQFRGEIIGGLAAGVPAVAGWTSTPPIPKAISAEHAQRAIDSCDCQTQWVGVTVRCCCFWLAWDSVLARSSG